MSVRGMGNARLAAALSRLGWDTQAMDERLSAYRHQRPWCGDLLPLSPAAERGAP
jgi:hypothetical protein